MKTIKRITLLVLISSIITTFSCTKEGKQGEPGPAGTNGTNGTNGNANVKSSTHTVYSWEWSTSGSSKYVDITSTLITNDILNSGAVLMYVKSGVSWQALPFTFPQGSSSILYKYLYAYNLVQIQITQETGVPSITGNLEFKLVVISSSARLSNPHIDFNDYYQVKGAFNLKD
ncbi:MAG: hypothetical protein KFKLKKLM_02034 [Flavobacteriales bacterium]|nr:hypothetical protein [Flavobacteriales bacterium]